MASAELSAPPGLTLQAIDETKGVNKLRELAESFSPPVSTEHCVTVSEKRERLRCAFKKANKSMSRDLESFGKMMEDLKDSDSKMRGELSRLFELTRVLLEKIVRQENVIEKQLQQEESTKDYRHKLQAFQRLLHNEECPVVVAGQISSGKSTLMNLFLGEEVLPSQLLSCTATICEMSYSRTPRAELLWEDGRTEPVKYEEKDKYIYKSDEREKRFDHEAVRIHMPVPFLKSGITLVDTPGVGENKEMWEVLTEYVTKKDVFGFIFAIKCDDSGGVLSRFKEMLRQLSMIKDKQGQFKLDPKSIIFVANFWDKVKTNDKDKVKDAIKDHLLRESCLEGIDLENQLFFVNSRFAWHTWKVGLISEDYEQLIKAVERFFPIGHKRKLKLCYMWLENLLLRVLHPVHAFLNKAERSTHSLVQSVGKVTQKLLILEDAALQAKKAIRDFFEERRKELMLKVEEFFKKPGTRKKITTWGLKDVPKEEYADSWVLIEERIEQVIDERVSSVLQEWEVNNKNFATAERIITERIRLIYGKVFTDLEDLEMMMRDMHGAEDKQEAAAVRRATSVVEVPSDSDTPREFRVDVAHEFSVEQPALHIVLNNLMSNPASLFHMGRRSRQRTQQLNAEKYQANKGKYMEERAEIVFSRLKDSDQTVRQLVDEQLATAEKSMEFVHSNIAGFINSNRALVSELHNDKRAKPVLENTYRPLAEQLNGILEETISFMYKNIHDYDFPENSLKVKQPLLTRRSQAPVKQRSMVSCVEIVEDLKKHEFFTKQMQVSSEFKRRHLFMMATNIRTLCKYKQARRFIPTLLGTALYQAEPALVFDGTMTTARKYLLEGSVQKSPGKNSRATYINNDFKNFMMGVSKAVEFLHLKRLVHVELSLDSVLVQENTPKLSNLFESMEVPYPSGDPNVLSGNYVYMAPETFPCKGSKRYSDSADVYALGLMFLELWGQCDLYGNVGTNHRKGPKELCLQVFMMERDPGEKLFQCINQRDATYRQNLPEAMIKRCLSVNPRDRYSAKEWVNQLKVFNCKDYRLADKM